MEDEDEAVVVVVVVVDTSFRNLKTTTSVNATAMSLITLWETLIVLYPVMLPLDSKMAASNAWADDNRTWTLVDWKTFFDTSSNDESDDDDENISPVNLKAAIGAWVCEGLV